MSNSSPDNTRGRTGGVPAWIGPLVLLASAAYLGLRFHDLPARWIVHWGPGGVPDGWASRTPGQVFTPLLLGAAVLALLELVGLAAAASGGARAGLAPLARATADLLRLLGIALALCFAALAILLPLGPPMAPEAIAPGVIGAVLVALLLGGLRLRRAVEEVRRTDPQSVAGHRGFYYSNPEDPRLWVPKLLGVGLTLNFAHRRAWPVLALLLGLPVGVALLLIALAGHR